MMEIYINNYNIRTIYGITILDYSEAFNFAGQRVDERTWVDKSGVEKNVANVRLDSREFVLSCIVKEASLIAAYDKISTFLDYMRVNGVFILSFRDTELGVRQAFLCGRSNAIVGDIKVRQQNTIYAFKLGLKEINANCIKSFTNAVYNGGTGRYEASIAYTKGQVAQIYWGNGIEGVVSNSGTYVNGDYQSSGPVDIIIDIDKDAEVISTLSANFIADHTTGTLPFTVQFSDLSIGDVTLWSWNFGDGSSSSEQNPAHVYTQPGIYTVTLQVFNALSGFDVETKTNYIICGNARILLNSTDVLLINATDKLLKN